MDKTLTRIRLITEELYLVRDDEPNKRAALSFSTATPDFAN